MGHDAAPQQTLQEAVRDLGHGRRIELEGAGHLDESARRQLLAPYQGRCLGVGQLNASWVLPLATLCQGSTSAPAVS